MNTEFMSSLSIQLIFTKAFINFIDAFIVYLFCVVLYNKKCSAKRIVIFCFVFPGVLLGGNLCIKYMNHIPDILIIFILIAIIIIMQKKILKISVLQSIFLFFISSIFTSFIGEQLSSFILKTFFGISIISPLKVINFYIYISDSLLAKLFQVIILLLIRMSELKFPIIPKINNKKFIIILAFFIVTMIILVLNDYFYMGSSLSNTIDKKVLIMFICIMVAYALIYVIARAIFMRFEVKDQELEYQKSCNNALDHVITDLRCQTHNFDNTLASISGYIQLERWDTLKKYFNEVAMVRRKSNSINFTKLLNIKNAGLLGVLISKLELATDEGLEMEVKILGEICDTKMRVSDLCETVGILLDNAIEAASESIEKKIILSIENVKGVIYFKIENTMNDKPEITKIYSKSWSTKGNNRGMGLYIVKKIMNKNRDSGLNTRIEGDLFIQELSII